MIDNAMPPEQITSQISAFDKYGLPGLVIIALFLLVWFLIKEHGAERLLFRDSLDKNSDILRLLSGQLEARLK